MNNDVLKKFVRTLESQGKLNCKSLEKEEKFKREFMNFLNEHSISDEKKVIFENNFENLLDSIKEDFLELGMLAGK